MTRDERFLAALLGAVKSTAPDNPERRTETVLAEVQSSLDDETLTALGVRRCVDCLRGEARKLDGHAGGTMLARLADTLEGWFE